MTGKDKRTEMILLTLAGLPATVWLGLVFAPYLEDGLIDFIAGIAKGNIEPLKIELCSNSLKSVVCFFLCMFSGQLCISVPGRITGEERSMGLPGGETRMK